MRQYQFPQQRNPIPGATSQQTFPLPVKTSSWSSLARVDVVSAKPINGTTVQDWFIYPTNQPLFNFYWRDVNLILQGVGPRKLTEGATSQQTYIFPPNQPEIGRYSLLQTLRRIVAAPIRLEGATVQQQYIFPVSQPVNYGRAPNRFDSVPLFIFQPTVTPSGTAHSYAYFIG